MAGSLKAPKKTASKAAKKTATAVATISDPPRPTTRGATGTTIYAGYLREEYLQPLIGQHAYDVYDEMRRSDGQVKMVLSSIKNPIRSATFKHEPADDSDQAKKVADFLDWHWFKNPFFDWRTWISEALTSLDFGVSVHEFAMSTYQHREFGLVHVIGAMEMRKQKTIVRWIIEPGKGLIAVEQLAFGDTVREGATQIMLPAESLCIFTNEKEGDNFEGVSLLRAAYGSWLRKKHFLRMNMIGAEKAAIGVPVGKYPQGVDATQQAAFEKILGNFVVHEQSYLAMPMGYELDVIQIPFDSEKLMAAIQYEDTQMAKSALLSFMELGHHGNGGARSLGTDLSSFFLTSLQYVGDVIASKMDDLNEALVEANFGDPDMTPRALCTGINSKAGLELAQTLQALVTATILRPDDQLEASVRETYNLTQMQQTREEAQAEALKNPPPAPSVPGEKPQAGDKQPPEPGQPPAKAELSEADGEPPAFKPWRALTLYEKPLNFAATVADMDTGKARLTRVMRSGLEDLVKYILSQMEQRFAQKPTSRNKTMAKLAIKTDRYEAALYREMARTVGLGTESARRDMAAKMTGEHKYADDKTTKSNLEFLPPHVKEVLQAQAKKQAETQAAELRKILDYEVMDGDANQLPDKDVISDTENKLEEYVDSAKIENAAGTITAQSFDRGRDGFLFNPDNLKDIQALQYSAIIDGKTTDICLSLDGKIFKPNDPDADRFRPPNHFNCRSILVPITINEPDPELTGITPDPTNQALLEEYARRGKSPPDLAKIQKSRNL